MSIALDGFEILQHLGKHPELFAHIRADVDKQARGLVVKCLKTKSVNIEDMRNIRNALGAAHFELLVDGLKDAEVKSIVTRLDKHHPEMKTASAARRREHLNALSDASSDPHDPPVKAKKSTSKKSPVRLSSEVIDVYREGGKRRR
jgi:16S rRNA G1207 methylase RsmC